MQDETHTSLDKHAQAWLHLALHLAQPIFSKQKRQQTKTQTIQHMVWKQLSRGLANYHIMLNSSHLVNTPRIAFKMYCMIIRHKKRSYLEYKQKDLHLLLEQNVEEEGDSTLPFTPQEAIDYCTKSYTFGQTNNAHLFQTFNFKMFLQRKIMGHYERLSNSQGMRYSWAEMWVFLMGYKWSIWANQKDI